MRFQQWFCRSWLADVMYINPDTISMSLLLSACEREEIRDVLPRYNMRLFPTMQAESSTSGTQQHAALEKHSRCEDHRGEKRKQCKMDEKGWHAGEEGAVLKIWYQEYFCREHLQVTLLEALKWCLSWRHFSHVFTFAFHQRYCTGTWLHGHVSVTTHPINKPCYSYWQTQLWPQIITGLKIYISC